MTPQLSCYTFNSAIVRTPAPSVIHGLRAENRGNPDYEKLKIAHEEYIRTLESLGLDVMVLPELEAFPDSIFVEDPAIVFPEGAVVLRPGAPSRMGETEKIRPVLEDLFDTVLENEEGCVDGGDLLVTPAHVMIGLSARTDQTGAENLIQILRTLGYQGRIANTPKGILHFKTACSLLDDETVLVTERMDQSGMFEGFNTIVVPMGEDAAANALRINDTVLVSAQYKRTADLLDSKGFSVKPINTSEIEKIDAGLSCMSLRWFRRP